MTRLDRLPLWPDTVTAFYADRACSIRSSATRSVWGYTYRQLQHRYPDHTIGDFTTDDLAAFVTQRDLDGSRWAGATARNYTASRSIGTSSPFPDDAGTAETTISSATTCRCVIGSWTSPPRSIVTIGITSFGARI